MTNVPSRVRGRAGAQELKCSRAQRSWNFSVLFINIIMHITKNF
jgi:hypothetical protein